MRPLVVVALTLLAPLPYQAILEELTAPPRIERMTPVPTPVQGCCKTCRKGKACGNSCIERSDTCSKGAGCACNG